LSKLNVFDSADYGQLFIVGRAGDANLAAANHPGSFSRLAKRKKARGSRFPKPSFFQRSKLKI
jgi:hypothetical protein